jgi:hypothetical protein
VLFAGGLEQCSFAALALTVLVRDQRRWDGWQLERLRGLIDQGDGSWVVFDRQRGEVTQGGPRRLWDEGERLFDAWCALGAPNRDRFGRPSTLTAGTFSGWTILTVNTIGR